MTPTEQDKELREKIADVFDELYEPTNEFWHRDSGLHWAGKVMQLIAADRKRVALEARIDELTDATDMDGGNTVYVMVWRNGIGFPVHRDERIAELKAQQGEV